MRRVAIAVPLLCAASALFVGLHFYLARRLILDPGVEGPWRIALLGLLGALAATLVLQPFGERLLRPPLSRVIAWPASLWMGFAFLLLGLLAVSDAALWLAGRAALAAPEGLARAASASGVRAGAVVAIAFVAGTLAVRSALLPPRIRRVEVELARWPRALDGFRIAQISDLHIGPILGRRFAAAVTSRVNDLEADLVAVTGDLVDGSTRHLAQEVEPFARLRGRHGVFFVTGNHDHYSGARAWEGVIRELGIRPLRNQRVAIGRDGAEFDLAGVDDHRGDFFGRDGGEDLPRALAGRDPERACVLLAHDPATFPRAAEFGIDLQLSGHTHGGQIWPFRWLVRLVVPYVAGLHRRNGSQLYVSCGTGFWGPPMRLRAPAEITEIVLRCAH
ncbi:MAG: metallophosphoesterase [Myxococcota bacterium]